MKQEKFITSQPPRIRGGMVVIPRGLLDARVRQARPSGVPKGFAEDPAARRVIELAAMEAVMEAERRSAMSQPTCPRRRSATTSHRYSPTTQHLRFIEVKGRIDGADSVMITRQEVITSLHEPDKFILAVVQVDNGFARAPATSAARLMTANRALTKAPSSMT